jgi:hypothetical protein
MTEIDEDSEIWRLIDHGGGQTCNVRGVLRALEEAGYVIIHLDDLAERHCDAFDDGVEMAMLDIGPVAGSA